ncbi:MAG: NAD(P)/FAD-dependent oxidoreductase [Rhodobacteraceae bacterium]|nr:NAD(P)/FAD-dependent oxidoreductase [Paracoccaceae bacterium]
MADDRKYDAIVVGGGHNGLTCGAYLARAGKKVLVLEQKPHIGGASVTEEFAPGFRASTYSFIMGHLHPKVIEELELKRYGLDWISQPDVVNPTDDDCIVFSKDPKKTQEQIARFSKKDAENYPKFFARLTRTIEILRMLQLETPVNPFRKDPVGLWRTGRLAWKLRNSEKEVYTLLQALSMSAYDYVSRWFETDVVKAKFMFWATIGGNAGPYAPGTAFYLVTHLVGQLGMSFARGGMGAIADAIAASGQAHGMEIQCDAWVDEILVRDGAAMGVRLRSGEVIRASRVISNVNVRRTFLDMVDRAHLPEEFVEDVEGFRSRGMGFKLLCAVERPPQYKGFDPEKAGTEAASYAHICPTPEFLERAFHDAKFGWYSQEPFLSPNVPSMFDDTLAPPGKHVVVIQGGVTPYELRNSDWESEGPNLVRNAFAVMDRFAPGFSDSVIAHKLYTPRDIEADINMPGGNSQHGELTLDQLFFMRPVPGYADYRSPVRRLYQCGASSHPGGAVSAVPGHNAAREILKDWRWSLR